MAPSLVLCGPPTRSRPSASVKMVEHDLAAASAPSPAGEETWRNVDAKGAARAAERRIPLPPLYHCGDGEGALRAEDGGVADARELVQGVQVAAGGAGDGVGHGQRVLDAREGAVEEPEAGVERAAVDHLADDLDAVGAEEPEGAGGRR